MLIRDLSSQECQDFLTRVGIGRLACARDNQPYVVPVYITYEPGRLYGFSTVGQKIEWMRSNPLVCVEADEVRSHFDWQSVVIVGHYEEYPNTPQYKEARRYAEALLEKRFLWWQTAYAAQQVRNHAPRTAPIFYCVHIKEITGHRACPDPIEIAAGFAAPST